MSGCHSHGHGHGHGASHQGCASHGEGSLDDALAQMAKAEARGKIRHVLVVLSGKGGVGKSTVAVNLAAALALAGHRVGLLDVDLHGPSIPTMLGLQNAMVRPSGTGVMPVESEGMKVMSIGFLLENPDSPVIWRGPAKAGVITQLVEEVAWGELDYLVVDCPPGTGDEPLSIIQTLGTVDGAVVVTTPQDVALADVRKSIRFCESVGAEVLGVVENMSGLLCPHCQELIDVFKSGGGEAMADEMGVPFLGRIPIDPQLVSAGDDGTPFVRAFAQSPTAAIVADMAQQLVAACEADDASPEKERTMRIAIPLAEGQLCLHFGHCEQFALVDVDPTTRQVTGTTYQTPPPHAPGVIPQWLHKEGATTIIAGGMGGHAQALFAAAGITVVTGAPVATPEALVTAYLEGSLVTGANTCDH